MTPMAERVRALFVSPAAPIEAPATWTPPAAAKSSAGEVPSERFDAARMRVARRGLLTIVLEPSGAAAPVGAAVANELRCRARARTALLIVWAPSGVPAAAAPAWPAARRLAERLEAGGSSAVARGRLVRVDLPPDPEAAAARIPELIAGDAPAVLVLAGPRPATFDQVLAAARLVVLVTDADRPPAVEELAVEELAHRGARVSIMAPMGSATARVVAGAGLGRLRRLSAAEGEGRGVTRADTAPGERGQATVLLVALMMALMVGAVMLGGVGQGFGALGASQRAADLAALAAGRAMHAAQPRLFAPATIDGVPNPGHLERPAYRALAREAAGNVARRNGAEKVEVAFPDGESFAPVRVRVRAERRLAIGAPRLRRLLSLGADAEAELAPQLGDGLGAFGAGGGYDGPLAHRQGKPMRPDVALAFDRLQSAAQAAGVQLAINSAFRSDAEQAILFARRPDPRWVAPPGKSLHRNATELDLGPASAYGWLSRNARRFGFVQRYSWEPWHYGYVLNPRSAPRAARSAPDGSSAVPDFVPRSFAPMLVRSAQRWNVSAALLAAQLYVESGFNPYARSPAGAQGIAQFMPATAREYQLSNPFDAAAAIDAQGHLMRDLLRRFGSVALALAAYNAGAGRVGACGCVPPFPETRGYVARVIALMNGAGVAGDTGGGGLAVRLVA